MDVQYVDKECSSSVDRRLVVWFEIEGVEPFIIEEFIEVVRLIPQERIQQRTVEQIVVVSCTSSRETNGGNEPDHSPERIIRDKIVDVTMVVQRQIPTIQNSRTMEILQIQFLDRVVDVPVDDTWMTVAIALLISRWKW